MKILVAYRGTKIDQDLLLLAQKHAEAFKGNIILVTSLIGKEKENSDQVIAAKKKLEEAKSFLSGKNVSCETHLLVRGNTPGEDIVDYAEENGIDQILIGVKNRSKVGKLIFGSTAQYVILKSPCPVTTVK